MALRGMLIATLTSLLPTACAWGAPGYTNTVLVASHASYKPTCMVDPLLLNGWGVAIRPPGAGGHFWISNAGSGTTTTYVGDVHTDSGFKPLYQDELALVHIPLGKGTWPDGRPITEFSQPTGQVFNHSAKDFIVTGEGITGPAKFIFVTGEGTISAWTEIKDEQGRMHRQSKAVIMVDQSDQYYDDRLRYTGCAVTDFPENNRLYATNWIEDRVEVYDREFKRVDLPPGRFRYPGQPEGYLAWNIQLFRTGPDNGSGAEPRLWVAYALREEPWEQDSSFGAVAEFDLDGHFIRRLTIPLDRDPILDSDLKAPWGLAIAPKDFGPLSGAMLVANFGDGSIAAFNLKSGEFIDYLRDDAGKPLLVDGIWGLTFGNGVALGDANALYYAAGPNSEADGTFGSIRYTPTTCPTITSQPQAARAVIAGAPARLSTKASSPAAIEYRWQFETAGAWSDLADGQWTLQEGLSGNAIGAHTPELTLSLDQPRSVRVRCLVRNACGSATSDATTVVGLHGPTPATEAPSVEIEVTSR